MEERVEVVAAVKRAAVKETAGTPVVTETAVLARQVRQRLRPYLDPPPPWNPTVGLFLAGYGLAALTVWGWFVAGWPLPLLLITGFLALHLEGTVIHDACHNAAHPNRIVNAVMGHGAALLLGFSFPVFTRVHLEHHAHVNDPRRDPEHVVSTWGPLWLIAPRFFYQEVFFFRWKLWRRWELWEWALARALFVALILAAWAFGFLPFILNCWFAPALMVGVTLGMFFDYLPHRPFRSRNRWQNARVYPSRVMNWLIMGQNYHLVHHIWPSIPWFEYQPAYRVARPLLEAKGSPLRLGLLESRADIANVLYDLLIGVRSHRRRRSRLRPLASLLPLPAWRRRLLHWLHVTAVGPL